MDEVDIDKSHSLDFYEYLLVVDKVTKKSGKRTTQFHYTTHHPTHKKKKKKII